MKLVILASGAAAQSEAVQPLGKEHKGLLPSDAVGSSGGPSSKPDVPATIGDQGAQSVPGGALNDSAVPPQGGPVPQPAGPADPVGPHGSLSDNPFSKVDAETKQKCDKICNANAGSESSTTTKAATKAATKAGKKAKKGRSLANPLGTPDGTPSIPPSSTGSDPLGSPSVVADAGEGSVFEKSCKKMCVDLLAFCKDKVPATTTAAEKNKKEKNKSSLRRLQKRMVDRLRRGAKTTKKKPSTKSTAKKPSAADQQDESSTKDDESSTKDDEERCENIDESLEDIAANLLKKDSRRSESRGRGVPLANPVSGRSGLLAVFSAVLSVL